ncbi:MAG: glutathione S-transferase family protein [Pseudohongiellaceae bacterium]
MSIKLYGFPVSNYYNMVKTVLIEKGMQFDEVLVKPSQDSDYLSKSPMGKVPALETEQGFLTETGVMIDYLESLGEGPSFYPADPFEKAKVQEIIRYLELYIELPARRLYGDVFFGRPASDELKAEVRPQLEKGFAALAKIAKYQPYIAGAQLSYADFYFRFSFNLATLVCKKALAWDAQGEFPAAKELMGLLDQRESIQKVLADQKA